MRWPISSRLKGQGLSLRLSRALLGSALLACALLALPNDSRAAPTAFGAATLQLDSSSDNIDVRALGTRWADAEGLASIQEVSSPAFAARFQASEAESAFPAVAKGALWQHFRFLADPKQEQDWLLSFPLPLIDEVSVYQKSPNGRWTVQTMGDHLAVASWARPGRYPQFRLNLSASSVSDVYVRIRHTTSSVIPVAVGTQQHQQLHTQYEAMATGAALGLLVLLLLWCAAQSWLYSDRVYGWYALYAGLQTLLICAWTGVAGQLFWPNWPEMTDTAPGVLGILTMGCSLLLVTRLCSSSARHRWFEKAVLGLALAALPLALGYVFAERSGAVKVVALYLIAAVAAGLTRALMSWRKKDAVGIWLLLAYLPIAFAALALLVRNLALTPLPWMGQWWLLSALVLEVPLLLVALNLRSRPRHLAQDRAQSLLDEDVLTGLLSAPAFHTRLQQAITRCRKRHDVAAVIYIELANFELIKRSYGVAVAEKSLLRCVIKLGRILGDVDSAGRVDEAKFGVILGGARDQQEVFELASKLVAAGLMPLAGLVPDVLLKFHISAVLLSDSVGDAAELDEALSSTLAAMGSRTKKPIRFVAPVLTRPMYPQTVAETVLN